MALDLYCEIDGLQVRLGDRDLTSAGLFVPTTLPPDMDTEMEIFLRSDAGEVTVSGQVVQIISVEQAEQEMRSPGYGVLFTHLTYDDRVWIGKTMELLKTASVPPEAPAQLPAPESLISRRRRRTRRTREIGPKRSDDEEQSPLRKLQGELVSLQREAPHRILGVSATASAAEAKTAFFAASKKYHPHVYAKHNSPEINAVVTELFIVHKRAYEALAAMAAEQPEDAPAAKSDPPAKTKSKSGRPPGGGENTSMRPIPAYKALRAPQHSVRPQNSTRPPPSRGKAPVRREASKEAQAEMALNAALKLLAQSSFDAAQKGLERALAANPDATSIEIWLHVCKARHAKAEGRLQDANGHYLEVLRLDPRHHEAQTALQENATTSTGRTRKLFGKLFGPENE